MFATVRLAITFACMAFVGIQLPTTSVGAPPKNPPEGTRLPGWIGAFNTADKQPVQRVDPEMQLHWDHPRNFDERLAGGSPLKVSWSGYLEVKTPGTYRLALQVVGNCRLWLNEDLVLQGSATELQILRSEPLELSFGAYPIRLDFESAGDAGQVQLLWQGPDFQWEPVSDRYLSHAAGAQPHDYFERGRVLARGLRCLACHTTETDTQTNNAHSPLDSLLQSPELTSLDGNLDRQWLIDWLMASPTSEPDINAASADVATEHLPDDVISRRMPHFGMLPQDATDIATALFSASRKLDPKSVPPTEKTKSSATKSSAEKDKSKDKKPARTQPEAAAGKNLVLTRGCVACHAIRQFGIGLRDPDEEANSLPHVRQDYLMDQLFSGGDLSDIASKRPDHFFARWLADPASINTQHRMPSVELTPLERDDAALLLATLTTTTTKDSKQDSTALQGDAARGKQLIGQFRCASCHLLPESLKPTAVPRTVLTDNSQWTAGCLGSPTASAQRPGFGLTQQQRLALRNYWNSYWAGSAKQRDTKQTTSAESVDMLLAERNCFACHGRGTHQGLAARALQAVTHHSELTARLPAMLPPSLNGVGDKLHAQALRDSIAQPTKPHRPWLDIRMPKFQLSDARLNSVVDHFIKSDRLPVMEPTNQVKLADDIVTRSAAGRLVTSEGFGCQSCHQIGNQPPPTVALNARGTDLTMLGERVRKSWFDRWVRNPVRIVPRMEMPAIKLPVHGVMDNDLNRQIDAVWEMLNTSGFQPPTPSPVRVVRGHNTAVAEPANVLTDVLETSERTYLRPLIVGLDNRHNVLIDLERGELAKWWIGDTARELTRGKSWYWELGGQPLNGKLLSLLSFQWQDAAGQLWKPAAVEQFAVEFDSLVHTARGLSWNGRLHLASGAQKQLVPLHCEIEPHRPQAESPSGLSIVLSMSIPTGSAWIIEAGAASERLRPVTQDQEWSVALDSKSRISFRAIDSPIKLTSDDQLKIQANERGIAQFEMRLLTDWPVDQVVQDLVPTAAPMAATTATKVAATGTTATTAQPIELDIVPGFRAIQYPLPRTEMPTALAWYRGQLVVGSLKGRVCLAVDRDGDGLPETWTPISDDLPAPYGIAASEQGVDVLAKFGLMRLTPNADLTTPWSMTTVADGWGYTADYHDWAVGLPQDSAGNYYVALPCQQDDRTPSAARMRGTIQKLIPQTPTSQDPRAYRLETLAAGQRFPMGLAFDSQERLFATDNQGNYNPFNELNHIRPGQRYGFINKLENKPDFKPPLESPAVNLPHPWTRSVNGICFLNTPKTATTPNRFGPFEGHCIGCEYNGLSLIRMSLEDVDGVQQGAAYLFSRPPAPDQPTFEGPVVCAVSPQGDLIVGNIHDSGWGGGQNTGSIVQVTPTGQWPLGIASVQASATGFRIQFTQSVDPTLATLPQTYSIRSYRRTSTPAYGGNDQEERQESVARVDLLDTNTAVEVTLADLRADTVYEIRIGEVVKGYSLFPNEAHYTMKRIPKSK